MITLPEQLLALQPEAGAAYRRAMETVLPLSDQRLLDLCTEQLRAAQRRAVWQPPADCSGYERAACALADQFAVDVDAIDAEQIRALAGESGEEAVHALVNALYLIDMALRLESVVPVVLRPEGGAAVDAGRAEPVGQDAPPPLDEVIADFAAAAVRADGIDPVTGELVRLRCAQVHHCRLCGSLRQRAALDAGLGDDADARVARYESGGFDAAAVAALRLCDTLILCPADASESLRDELARHYTEAQVAELCFDVVKWSQQKALVATRSDAPPWEGIHVLDFDEQGHPQFAGPVAGAG